MVQGSESTSNKPNWAKQDILGVILTEYGALRSEIVSCLSSQYLVWSFGIPVIGAAVIAGFSWWSQAVSSVIFFILIPLLTLLLLVLWGNQVARMNRAGAYISDFIEKKIETIMGDDYRKLVPHPKAASGFSLPELSPRVSAIGEGDRRIESVESCFTSIIGWEAWLRSKGLAQLYRSYRPWRYYPFTQRSIVYIGFSIYFLSTIVGCIEILISVSDWSLFVKLAIIVIAITTAYFAYTKIGLALLDVTTQKRLSPVADYLRYRH